MKQVLFFFAVLGLVMMYSCEKSFDSELLSDEELELQTDQHAMQPTAQYQTMTKPAQPGDNMKVFRGQTAIGFLFNDADRGVSAFVNVDYEALCAGGPFAEPVDFQTIVKEDEENFRAIRQLKGDDVKVSAWGIVGGVNCGYYLNNEPLFDGLGDFVFTDNDINPFANDGNQKNAYGMSLHGDGISISARFVFDKVTGEYINRVVNIRVK